MRTMTFSRLIFLPLLALVTIDLAPVAEAQRGSSSSGSTRSSGSSLGSSSGSSRSSVGSSQSRSQGSTRSSSGGSTRSSGGTVRQSGGTTRSSGVTVRPSSGSSSTPSIGSTSRTPRVTGTTGSTTRDRGTSSGSVTTQPRVRYVSPTTRTTGTTTGDTRSGATTPTYGDSRSTGSATGSTNAPSYDRTPSTTGTTRSTDSVGEAYQPASRSRFPLPLTSRDPEGTASVEANGRTTYARRFDALGTAARAAAADRIRAENGIKPASEVSLDDIRDRYRGDTSTTDTGTGYRSRLSEVLADNNRAASSEGTRVRSSSGPGARYRQQIAQEAQDRQAREAADKMPSAERIRYNMANPNDDTRKDLSELALGGSATQAGKIESTSGNRARPVPTAKEADSQARLRQVFDAEGARGAFNAAEAASEATGLALGLATRATLGTAGSAQLRATFNQRSSYSSDGLTGTAPGAGAGGGGTDFDGYDDDSYAGTTFYGYPNGSHSSWGLSYGYWDSNGYYHSPYSSWFSWSFGWCSSFGLNFGYGYPYYYSSYYNCPTSYYYPYVSSYYGNSYSNGYGDGYDDGYSTAAYGGYSEPVVVNVYQDGPVGEVVYADAEPEVEIVVGTAPAVAAAPEAVDAPLSAAALRYLELGDEAFGAGRYADAVHFYSRSIEFEPKRGMLHLVLADALFATGDYHYCAHTIRRALELEPSLVAAPVDKHLFYAAPAEFDQQLAVLELFLADNPTNVDAKLVLGLNYLFGNRPQAAVELLSKGPNASAAFSDNAATLILQSAEIHQWGDNPPADATWE